jgi:micrococcal nuclease
MGAFFIRFMARKKLKYLINVILLFAAILAYFTLSHLAGGGEQGGLFYVIRVIDGDTIKLSNGERVRLIGIDTPESRYNNKLERDAARSRKDINTILKLGKEASGFTRNLVEGKRIRLEFDIEKRDKYGRLLAYVYLEDGTFVNAKVLEEGYAQIMTIPPNVKYADYFSKLQREARQNHKGLWKISADKVLF